VHLITLSPSSLTLPLRGTPAPAGVLGIKHSRSVTSLAFSSHDPNLLAVGYERHRSDHSLLIWDISDTIGSFPPDPDGERGYVRPPQRLEATNTAAAAHDSPRHLQQYCPSEVVHSVAWMPGSGAELYASANNKAVRLYDLRQPTRDAGATGPVQWATRAVHHLTPDPALPTRIASVEANQYGGVVRLWDARKPGQEVSFLEVPEGSTIVGLEWAQGSAEIAIGTREGGVKISRVVNGPQRYDGSYEWVSMGDVRHGEYCRSEGGVGLCDGVMV
jgi:WD40 repeat protein